MKLAAKIVVVLMTMTLLMLVLNAGLRAIRPESSPPSPPDCTNTTIDKYYKCQPTAPIMLRKR